MSKLNNDPMPKPREPVLPPIIYEGNGYGNYEDNPKMRATYNFVPKI